MRMIENACPTWKSAESHEYELSLKRFFKEINLDSEFILQISFSLGEYGLNWKRSFWFRSDLNLLIFLELRVQI